VTSGFCRTLEEGTNGDGQEALVPTEQCFNGDVCTFVNENGDEWKCSCNFAMIWYCATP
jgi:hypothetical protein